MPFYCSAPTTEYIAAYTCVNGYDFTDDECCSRELFDFWEWMVWLACASVLCCVVTTVSAFIAYDRRKAIIAENKALEDALYSHVDATKPIDPSAIYS